MLRRIKYNYFGIYRNPSEYWNGAGVDSFLRIKKNSPPSAMNKLEKGTKIIYKVIHTLNAEYILDAGCGYGRFIVELLPLTQGTRFMGIDISNRAISSAQDFCNDKRVSFEHGTLSNILVKDKHFDLAFTFGVMAYIKPKEVKCIMKELVRASKFILHMEVYEEKEIGWTYPYGKWYRNMGCKLMLDYTVDIPPKFNVVLVKTERG